MPTLLALDESCPYFRLGMKWVLMLAGSWLLVAEFVSIVEGVGCCGIGCSAVYSREYAARSRAVWRVVLTAVIARLAGRTKGLLPSSSVVPSTLYPGARLLRTDKVLRPTWEGEDVWTGGTAVGEL